MSARQELTEKNMILAQSHNNSTKIKFDKLMTEAYEEHILKSFNIKNYLDSCNTAAAQMNSSMFVFYSIGDTNTNMGVAENAVKQVQDQQKNKKESMVSEGVQKEDCETIEYIEGLRAKIKGLEDKVSMYESEIDELKIMYKDLKEKYDSINIDWQIYQIDVQMQKINMLKNHICYVDDKCYKLELKEKELINNLKDQSKFKTEIDKQNLKLNNLILENQELLISCEKLGNQNSLQKDKINKFETQLNEKLDENESLKNKIQDCEISIQTLIEEQTEQKAKENDRNLNAIKEHLMIMKSKQGTFCVSYDEYI